jgi:hypothetical protein
MVLRQCKVEELVIDRDIGYAVNLAALSNIRVQDTLR